MKKLRLLITEECNRSCPGCCNLDWDLKALEKCTDFSGYDEIILTGGEPMLFPDKIREILMRIDYPTGDRPKIYMYTALVNLSTAQLLNIYLDGITITFHNQKDVDNFAKVQYALEPKFYNVNRSLRLNVFEGIDISALNLERWKVKDNMVWLENCPLPKDEVFMRY